MRRLSWMVLGGFALVLCGAPGGMAQDRDGLEPFASDEALAAFLTEPSEDEPQSGYTDDMMSSPPVSPPPSPSPPPPPPPPSAAMEAGATAAPANPSITNNQIAGVDEGGIVKVSGDYLVILRRGRLFSVSTAGDNLEPVGHIDAFPPGSDGASGWYDEMLISGDMVVVVGYNYGRGGTEINRFRLGRDGRFTFVDSHNLRSNDYYSAENYASRLVGTQLIFYTPLQVRWGDDPLDSLPAMRRWSGSEAGAWERTATARQVFMAPALRARGRSAVEGMHTVTSCDLAAAEMRCRSTVILGGGSRTFFVSQNAVYVWTGPQIRWDGRAQHELTPALLYRLPFDGSRPQAVEVRGNPINQFSFSPNAEEGRMDILVSAGSDGDAMWNSRSTHGAMALLRLPMSRFGDGSEETPPSDYQMLPSPGANGPVTTNRFVGGWALYALTRYGSLGGGKTDLIATPVAGGEPVEIAFNAGIERIEVLGRDALIVGGSDSVVFSTLVLGGDTPVVGSTFTQPQARQGESRSHAFFYRADGDDGDTGLMGLPILGSAETSGRWTPTASMLFLRRDERALSDFGRLTAEPAAGVNDRCVASCVDWYGNARPIFLGRRVFALMGYELVEGREGGERIEEVRRVDFIPAPGGRP